MLIDFNELKEIHMPGMNNGTGEITARMYMDDKGKIIPCAIHAGGSMMKTLDFTCSGTIT